MDPRIKRGTGIMAVGPVGANALWIIPGGFRQANAGYMD